MTLLAMAKEPQLDPSSIDYVTELTKPKLTKGKRYEVLKKLMVHTVDYFKRVDRFPEEFIKCVKLNLIRKEEEHIVFQMLKVKKQNIEILVKFLAEFKDSYLLKEKRIDLIQHSLHHHWYAINLIKDQALIDENERDLVVNVILSHNNSIEEYFSNEKCKWAHRAEDRKIAYDAIFKSKTYQKVNLLVVYMKHFNVTPKERKELFQDLLDNGDKRSFYVYTSGVDYTKEERKAIVDKCIVDYQWVMDTIRHNEDFKLTKEEMDLIKKLHGKSIFKHEYKNRPSDFFKEYRYQIWGDGEYFDEIVKWVKRTRKLDYSEYIIGIVDRGEYVIDKETYELLQTIMITEKMLL